MPVVGTVSRPVQGLVLPDGVRRINRNHWLADEMLCCVVAGTQGTRELVFGYPPTGGRTTVNGAAENGLTSDTIADQYADFHYLPRPPTVFGALGTSEKFTCLYVGQMRGSIAYQPTLWKISHHSGYAPGYAGVRGLNYLGGGSTTRETSIYGVASSGYTPSNRTTTLGSTVGLIALLWEIDAGAGTAHKSIFGRQIYGLPGDVIRDAGTVSPMHADDHSIFNAGSPDMRVYPSYNAMEPGEGSHLFAMWPGVTIGDAARARSLVENPFSILEDPVRRTIFLPAAAAGHTLAPADLTVDASIDAAALTQTHLLPAADLSITDAIDPAVLAQTHLLPAADLSITDAIDPAVLTQTHLVAPADLTLSVAIDPATLSQLHQLAPAEMVISVAIDPATLAQLHALSPDDLVVAVAIDGTYASPAHVLAPDDIVLALAIDPASVVHTHAFQPADLAIVPSIDTAQIVQAHLLAPADLSIAVAIDVPSLAGLPELPVVRRIFNVPPRQRLFVIPARKRIFDA